MRNLIFVLLIVEPILFGCFAENINSISNAKLTLCISDYRDGYYARTIQCIDKALPELTSHRDSVESYKMLALSYGMINQIEKAKMYFGIILGDDSALEIDTLDFPPNIALIYNQVKLEKKMSHIETTAPVQPGIGQTKKRSAAVPLLLSSVILSTGGAVFLYTNGFLAHDEYSKLGNDQAKLDKKWEEFTLSTAGGIGCTVISGVTTWLFFRVLNKNSAASVSYDGDGVLVVYNF